MKYRAVIKQKDGWWIGWLVDLHGVNAQEKTCDRLIKSLIAGAKDMIESEIQLEEDAIITTIDVPDTISM